MAGEDFLPVGIKATVVGVDKFLADLRRMQTGITKFGDAVKETGIDLRTFSAGTDTTSKAAKQFNAQAKLMTQHSKTMNTSVRQLSTGLASLAAKMKAVNAQAARTNSSLGKTKQEYAQIGNVVARVGNALSSFIQKTARSTSVYKNNAQELQRLREHHARLKSALDQLQQEQTQSAQTASKLSAQWKKSSANQVKLLSAIKKTEGEMRRLRSSMEAFKKAGATTTQVMTKYGAKATVLIERHNKLTESYKRAKVETVQLGGAYDRASKQTSALAAHILSLQTRLTAFGETVSEQESRLRRLNIAIAILAGPFTAMAKAAEAAAFALGKAKAAVNTLLSPLARLNKLFVAGVTKVKKFNSRLTKLATRAFRVGNSIRFLGTSMTFLVSLPILGFMKSMIGGAIDFEEAWAGLIRTADDPALGKAFTLIEEGSTDIKDLTPFGENLQRGLRDLATTIPIAASELASLGEVAGALGIRGNKNLLTFIETSARLGATTNIASDDAARGLGKILNVSGGLSDAELSMAGFTQSQIDSMTASERFQISAEALGGVLTDLGNKTNANEDEIVNFTRKIYGVGNAIGLTSKEMLAFSSSFVAAGVDAARGGTAFQKMMVAMLSATREGGRELEIFAATAGKTVEEFVELFEHDATKAIEDFSSGVGNAGKDGVAILDALDLADARVLASILSLASAEGELSRALSLTNQELENQANGMNALLTESERRFSTTKNQLQLLKNQFTELGITIGAFVLPYITKLIGVVSKVVEKLTDLSPLVQKAILLFLGLVAVVGPVVTITGLLLATTGFLISTLLNAVGVILSVASAIGLWIFPILAVVAAIGGLVIVFIASFKKMKRFAGFAPNKRRSS